MYIPRLRKVPQAVKEIRAQDKNSAISEHLIKRLIKENKITNMKYGNAWLVNLDELYAFFSFKEKL